MGAAKRNGFSWWAWLLTGFGVLMGLGGVYWAYHI
jgi:hypothetical protein